MYQTVKEEDDPVVSRSTKTLFISNEAIETGMNISNLHARILKEVKINQKWNKVKDVTTEVRNVHPTTQPEFVIYHFVTQ